MLLLVLLAAGTLEAGTLETGMRPEMERWVGRYAMELRVGSTSKLPLLPTGRSTTVSLMLIEIRPGRDGGLVQQHHVCDVRMESSSSMRATVPDAFVRALAPRANPVQLRRGPRGWHYEVDMGLDAIGFDPRLSGGALPEQPTDPGVIDADGDGNPGATIEIRVPVMGRARLFIAQRTHLVLRAEATGPERIEGSVDIRLLEQRTLGAEPGHFRRTPDIRPDPRRSGFTLVRLSPGLGCAEVRARAATLFADEPLAGTRR